MLSAVRDELERNPLSWPAAYWLVVAARGAGDLDGAWNAAFTGWIRAGSQPEGEQLRGDLDRFVTQTLIPERAQARTGQRLDSKTDRRPRLRRRPSSGARSSEHWRAADLSPSVAHSVVPYPQQIATTRARGLGL